MNFKFLLFILSLFLIRLDAQVKYALQKDGYLFSGLQTMGTSHSIFGGMHFLTSSKGELVAYDGVEVDNNPAWTSQATLFKQAVTNVQVKMIFGSSHFPNLRVFAIEFFGTFRTPFTFTFTFLTAGSGENSYIVDPIMLKGANPVVFFHLGDRTFDYVSINNIETFSFHSHLVAEQALVFRPAIVTSQLPETRNIENTGASHSVSFQGRPITVFIAAFDAPPYKLKVTLSKNGREIGAGVALGTQLLRLHYSAFEAIASSFDSVTLAGFDETGNPQEIGAFSYEGSNVVISLPKFYDAVVDKKASLITYKTSTTTSQATIFATTSKDKTSTIPASQATTSVTTSEDKTSTTSTEDETFATTTEDKTSATTNQATTSATTTEDKTSATTSKATTSATTTEDETSATTTEDKTSATTSQATTSATTTEDKTAATTSKATTSATTSKATTSATTSKATTSATTSKATTSATTSKATTSATTTEDETLATTSEGQIENWTDKNETDYAVAIIQNNMDNLPLLTSGIIFAGTMAVMSGLVLFTRIRLGPRFRRPVGGAVTHSSLDEGTPTSITSL
jgi:hypothetical protein